MTRMFPAVLALGALAAGPGLAQTSLPDANGDGVWSMEELQASVPDLTAETFAAIDANADGSVDATELAAAIDAGTIKPAT
jgi:hypothetical protein